MVQLYKIIVLTNKKTKLEHETNAKNRRKMSLISMITQIEIKRILNLKLFNLIHLIKLFCICVMTSLILFISIGCTKKGNRKNVLLYDKPQKEIQSNIYGSWKLRYTKGGFCAVCYTKFENYIWTYTKDNRIIQVKDGITLTDTTIEWKREQGTYTNGDSTFTMEFFDKSGFPYVHLVERIKDDTLILHDNFSDALYYFLTRQ